MSWSTSCCLLPNGNKHNGKGKTGNATGKHGYGIDKGSGTLSNVLGIFTIAARPKSIFSLAMASIVVCILQVRITCMTDWERWRLLLIDVHLSVQHGNIVKHFQNIAKKLKDAEHEFQIVDHDDEWDEINPSDSQFLQIPSGSASQIMKINQTQSRARGNESNRAEDGDGISHSL